MSDHCCGPEEGKVEAPPAKVVPPAGDVPRHRYRVSGMDCAEEIATLKAALKDLTAPESLGFDLLDGVMEVPTTVEPTVVQATVARTGMRATPVVAGAPLPETTWWERRRRDVLTAISGVGLALGFGLHAAIQGIEAAIGSEGMATNTKHGAPLPAILAYSVAIGAGLWVVLPKALHALRSLRPDMNLLMTLAVAGAVALGEWFEAGTVAFLFALSLALEAWSVGRARRAVEALLSLAPARIRVKRGDKLEEVDPATVPVGTVFVVRSGERIGLDGVVAAGTSEVDQAPITGESVPVLKEPGNDVFAGTINGNGLLEIRSTKAASDTTLAQIVKMVGEARQDRSQAERWVERFSRIYTPVVFAAAGLTMLVPPLILGGGWQDWIYRGLVLLVIGCPCALVISTPVSVVAGLASAARHGVLIKGGQQLEIPASLAVVAVDKTGTLTEGRPRVVEIVPSDDHTPQELLRVAAAIEGHSDHPLARAIVERATAEGIAVPTAEDVQTVPGKGITGRVDGKQWWLGSHRWVEERQQETPALHQMLVERTGIGQSAVILGTDDHVCGALLLSDAIRTDAKASIEALHKAGLKVAMLTGDNQGTAAAVASALGIDDVRAELLPADKVKAVEDLEKKYGPVGMIGDGVNDAPALARASLGVAMGGMGTDVAIETADVALMTDDLSRLAWLVDHSKRTLKIIRQNTIFALGVKAVFVLLTFLGVASLWGAIAADMGASLLVVFNALRLLRA